ncbi:MAG: carboxymuconolactone decarboxylase family protein [Burkholderiales bacterium]|nr:carboxymuconolactone decarboxylase family protein [Burkholderiales bacterium]
MPRIPVANPAHTDATTQATLNSLKAKLGVLPNMFLTLAQAPAALQSYVALSGALSGGKLNAKQREQIALAVGEDNACGYCLAAHTVIGGMVKLTPDEIAQARQGTAPNARDAALVQLAGRITATRGNLTEVDVAAARKAGLNDGDILEVIGNVALNIFTNYVNHIAQTEIDFPPVAVKAAA